MLIQAQEIERGARIEADICVIGTGPAGMTLLKELARPGMRIVVLESGGKTFDADAQVLCDGATISPNGYPGGALMTSRRRQLGGTANLWNDELDTGQGDELVRLVALDPIDFETRKWVPYSGWPFGKSELDTFYDRALTMVGAAPSADDCGLTTDHGAILGPEARLCTVLSRFAARAIFTRDLPHAFASDDAVSIYLNATLLELVLNNNTVSYARVASAPGREFQVAARFFVLAAGGIENARLLLLSNREHQTGLGNHHDLVGRFFMDHPSFRLGVFTPSNRDLVRSANLYDHHLRNGQPVMGKFTFHEETMRREEMLNICITLTPRGREYESAAAKALAQIIHSDSPAAAKTLLAREFRTLTKGWDEVVAKIYHKLAGTKLVYFENKGGWSRLPKPERRFRKFELCCLAEQAPNPENRVSLADELDLFGQRKAQLHWQWSEVDLRSIGRAQDILKEELEDQELGLFVRQRDLDETKPPLFSSPHHHIGTTRMHRDPARGVVNPDCRIHGLSNLYVAGSSVFPTAGFANPTLTIIALAIRLAYHLKELMRPALSSVATSIAAPTAPSEL